MDFEAEDKARNPEAPFSVKGDPGIFWRVSLIPKSRETQGRVNSFLATNMLFLRTNVP